MTREDWETLSIGLEYTAFFLAAPDLLGERGLIAVGRRLRRILAPFGRCLRRIADAVRDQIDVGWRRRTPGGYVLVVIVYDVVTAALAYCQIWAPGYIALIVLAVFNFTALVYLIEMAAVGALLMMRRNNLKGVFILVAGLLFSISKLIALGLVHGWWGHA
jgi:hypothetical protein